MFQYYYAYSKSSKIIVQYKHGQKVNINQLSLLLHQKNQQNLIFFEIIEQKTEKSNCVLVFLCIQPKKFHFREICFSI